jgi:hypothetical protein
MKIAVFVFYDEPTSGLGTPEDSSAGVQIAGTFLILT